jgi:hypothetical protein
MAAAGLQEWGIDGADIDRLLGIIEGRCLTGRNGAAWQADAFHRYYEHHDRSRALGEMMRGYVENMHSNEPVHTWAVPD